MLKPIAILCFLGISAPAALGALVTDVIYDFEEFDADSSFNSGALNSLDYTKDGVTMTLTRDSGTNFDLWDAADFGAQVPANWGRNNLSPFFAATTNDLFIADFNGEVLSGFSYEFGDYGADFDDTVRLEAYDGPNGTGNLIASALGSWDGDFGAGDNAGSLSVAANGIRSIKFGGGSPDFPNSLFYDNLTAKGVPAPGALALLGLAVVGRRRRRS